MDVDGKESEIQSRTKHASTTVNGSSQDAHRNGTIESSAVQQLNSRGLHRVFISFGSNMGDRIGWIERACRAMDEEEGVRVVRTSGLYETKAMYVEDQSNFINGACEVG